MTELDRTLLTHYKLTTLEPWEWPAEKDLSEPSDEELPRQSTKKQIRRSKSRYSALERNPSSRISVPGSQKNVDGVENLVQRDEPDPLGASPSVVQVLRQRGLPVEDDSQLRNRFLLSSTTFSPAMYLSQVHNTASTEALLQGLDFLSRSIEKKSASLKVLVESNFERFVRAKATIDNVYTEMRSHGAEPEPEPHARPHSRHASKSSAHFRRVSGAAATNNNKPLPSDRKKHALIKESDYGVQGIKAPLLEASVKAEEIWGPVLDGKEREETLKGILASVDKYRGVFEVAASIQDCIKRKDYEALGEEYSRAQRFAIEAKSTADMALRPNADITDPQIYQLVMTSRMWSDVESQIEVFKRDVWRRLAGTHFNKQAAEEENKPEEHIELISVLLELGVEDNPIWVWLLSRYDYLKNKVSATAERFKVEVEILRRRLANREKPDLKQRAVYLQSAHDQKRSSATSNIDSTAMIAFWDHVQSSLNAFLSTEGGVLGEALEFWETANSFIEGKAQRSLPVGTNGQSRKHHRLSSDGIHVLKSGAMELLSMIREGILSFFAEPPIDDISALFSPIPSVPDTPRTPLSAVLSPPPDARFRVDANSVPPPSPKRGEPWEKYAFWPPTATSLSGFLYLSKAMVVIGIAASEMATLDLDPRFKEQLRTLVGAVRERCVQAVCSAWNEDAEYCKALEDWTRSSERRDLTNMPSRFMAFQSSILSSMQKLLYLPDAMNKPGAADVVVPPSAKLLQIVRSQFVTTLYKAFSGMVENAEKPPKHINGSDDAEADALATPAADASGTDLGALKIDSSNKNVRMLLTLSNLQSIRSDIVPHLIAQFETNFSIKLTEESKTVRDVLGQIDTRLFQTYVKATAERLTSAVFDGIRSPSWVPSDNRPTDASPYVYDVLLSLVVVHSEVSTTAEPLTSRILKHMQEQLSFALIEAFKERPKYSLAALMQATLDVEFMAQTLNNYTTDIASDTQSKIYLALDERTDNDARLKLQKELPEMRATLKKLREGTRVEFACFKRQRVPKEKVERPQSRP